MQLYNWTVNHTYDMVDMDYCGDLYYAYKLMHEYIDGLVHDWSNSCCDSKRVTAVLH